MIKNDEMIGMNKKMLIQSTKYVLDRHLMLFGYKKLFNVENPFSFMLIIDI